MKTSDFDYDLPQELIAQEPAAVRDACRMLVMDRETGAIEDRIFRDIIDYLEPGDLLVANETRVLPARLLGAKRGTGGQSEVFLLRQLVGSKAQPYADVPHIPGQPVPGENQQAIWEVLVRPGKRLKPGSGAVVDFTDGEGNVALSAEIVDWAEGAQRGERVARLTTTYPSLDEALHAVGHTPLPPYIKHYAGDEELYQTVYSRRESSAAAPTAGLHFTKELLKQIEEMGVKIAHVTLHVGLGTFRPVKVENILDHHMHSEFYIVEESEAEKINSTRREGGRVICVGTTSCRTIESASSEDGVVKAGSGWTDIFIYPGYKFKVLDCLITNFHLPESTLVMLVSALAGREHVLAAYGEAVKERYRFFSFGDAMFIH